MIVFALQRTALELGPITIYWYGVFVALGFILGYMMMLWRAKTFSFPQNRVSDLCFASMIGGIIGARFLYILLHLHEYQENWLEIFRIDHGGLVFYGGLFGAVVAVLLLVWKHKLDWQVTADLFALGLPLGQTAGRIGCFINGCCWGKPTTSSFSCQYPESSFPWISQVNEHLLSPTAATSLPIFPVQLSQSITNISVWIILLVITPRIKQKGRLFSWYLILYSVGRFTNEFLRGDYDVLYGGLSISQLICLILFPIGWFLFYTTRIDKRPLKRSS